MSGRKLKRTEVAQAREILMKQQGYRCALCDCDFREQTVKARKRVSKYTPVLDHCHHHGHVRAVLCKNCNGKEGEIFNRATSCRRDGTALDWLKRLAEYWEKHEYPQTIYIHPEHKTEDEKRLARNAKERKKRANAKARKLLANKE
jgi:hypothetical protein